MPPMKAKLADMKITSFPKPKTLLTLELLGVDFSEAFDRLKDKLLTVTIKPAHRHRSLDANAYAWALMDKLADALTVSRAKPYRKEDVYRAAIRDIPGVSETLIVEASAVARFRAGWAHNGLGWQSEVLPSAYPGYVTVILYYGSSSYDTRQMGALLDYLIALGQELGVPTDTPEQVEKYKYYWAQAQAERKKS